MKDVLKLFVGFVLFVSFIYGCYWSAKTVSYEVFYRGMVEQTVKEMVRPESLN